MYTALPFSSPVTIIIFLLYWSLFFSLSSSASFFLICHLSRFHSLVLSLCAFLSFPIFFLMLSFLISILENFQTLRMNWALPYKCVHIYTEAHTLRDFGSLKGPREILLKRNKFRADSWKHPRNEHILIIPEILCSTPWGLPLIFMQNRCAYRPGMCCYQGTDYLLCPGALNDIRQSVLWRISSHKITHTMCVLW